MNKEELLYQIATLEEENKQLKEQLQKANDVIDSNLELIDYWERKVNKAIDILEDYQDSLYTKEDREDMSDNHIEMAIWYLKGYSNEQR